MGQANDQTVQLLRLAREMKRAAGRVQRTNPAQASHLLARVNAILRRVHELEAGQRPQPSPKNRALPSRDTHAHAGPFGLAHGRLAMIQGMGIDFRKLSAAMIGKKFR